jgi:DNA repair protein RadA/Sms
VTARRERAGARQSARVWECAACGHQSPRWLGRCPECGGWSTLEESAVPARSARPALGVAPAPVRLADLAGREPARLATGIPELDRVLGGGLVPGSLVLVGGEPGIGKSTLVLQALAGLAARGDRALLVTGEESGAQVAGRAARLGGCGDVEVLAETRLEPVLAALEAHRPAVCAIDSVQTLGSDLLDAPPGTVGQVRQVTAELMRVAKASDLALVLVGQVTKDGALAGPRLLEHLVDCVLTFEGDDARAHRVLRATKNRFGSTNETGVFEMRAGGLVSVDDPTALYLAEAGERVGSCRFPAVEGSRALLVEIQALVGPTEIVPPRRLAGGIDRTRLSQIVAVLGRHAGLRLGDQDIFVSVAGGARALDPAADLAIALAIASAHRGVPLPGGTAAVGELGLTGAVRPAGHLARRLAAAAGQGTARAVVPSTAAGEPADRTPDAVLGVATIHDALEVAFE